MNGAPKLSVLIPAHDESAWIARCLEAVLASGGDLPAREVIVIANACRDATAAIARGLSDQMQAGGWPLRVIETETPGKLNALNLGDHAARGGIRVYLDADVVVRPDLIAQIATTLEVAGPCYATGTPVIARASSAVSRAYARFWERLPFVTRGTPGFGLFAMNAAGRARWSDWPDIISDDMFARLQFAPNERIRVAARYEWPPVEGFGNLIRVRRRQNAGVSELARLYPALMQNEDLPQLGGGDLTRLILKDPVGFGVYAGVKLGVRSPLYASGTRWARGR